MIVRDVIAKLDLSLKVEINISYRFDNVRSERIERGLSYQLFMSTDDCLNYQVTNIRVVNNVLQIYCTDK